jgi:hypothetical protein
MEPTSKKSVLIVILTLMVLIIPAGIFGTYLHFKSAGTSDNNPNRAFHYNNKLYFYNYNNLIGTYNCENTTCDYAYETIDDDSYSLNYYDDNNIDQIKMINNQYAFIIDTANSSDEYYYDTPIILYDITNQRKIGTYKAVKNYTKGIENNIFIVENTESLWGVLEFGDTNSLIIPYSYNYIGVHNTIANNTDYLEADTFAVKDSSGWKLVNNKNGILTNTPYINDIYDYNNKYIICKNNDFYYLYNYSNALVVSFGYKNLNFIGDYVAALSSTNQFYIYNPTTNMDVSKRYLVNDISDVNYALTASGITITIDGDLKETINI